MPELPEVEALAQAFAIRTSGLTVASAAVAELSALKTFDPPLPALVGAVIEDVGRRGKFMDWILVTPDGEPIHLVIHLARAGWIRWVDNPAAAAPKPGRGPLAFRMTFAAAAGSVAGGVDVTEAGTRKRLAVYVVRSLDDVEGIGRLGPDPLASDFTQERFNQILDSAGNRQIKGVLRDQSAIAGIGNAWSDEILHLAKLSPLTLTSKLDDSTRARLYESMRSVLFSAVARVAGAAPEKMKSEKKASMGVHGRAGEKCPVCGDTVREVSFADSSFQYCPRCQTGGKILADRRLSRLLK